MIVDPIPLAGPSVTHREIECAADAAAVGWNMREAWYIRSFRRLVAAAVGQRHAYATSGRAGALHMAMAALGVGPGDEVLVPEIADVSLAYGVLYTGARPVFCDIDPRTLCLSPEAAAQRITGATRAVIAAHLYGQPCDMGGITSFARAHGLAVVEDATQGLGGHYCGAPAGSFGLFTVMSFSGREVVTCGEGGMLLGADEVLMRKAVKAGVLGRSGCNPFVHDASGFEYPMSNLQAAFGTAQMERLPELLDKKRLIASWYGERLAGVPGIRLPGEAPGTRSGFLMPLVFLEDASIVRTTFLRRLRASGVIAAPVFYPLSSMPVFAKADNPAAYGAGARALLLPGGHNRTEDEIDYVCSVVRALLADRSAPAARVLPGGWLLYKSDVLETIARAKKERLTLPFAHDGADYALRSLTAEDVEKPELVRLLADFRRENMHVFLRRYPVTDESMQRTMRVYLECARDFLLFFVTGGGTIFGHMGLDDFDFQKRECVAEGFMMRPDAPRGLAAAASETMYDWARDRLGIRRVYNHVVGSNRKVRLLAAAQGFREVNRTALYLQELPNGEAVFRPMYIQGHDRPDEYFVFSAKDLPPPGES